MTLVTPSGWQVLLDPELLSLSSFVNVLFRLVLRDLSLTSSMKLPV